VWELSAKYGRMTGVCQLSTGAGTHWVMTRGLGNSPNPTSDNLKPQETAKEDTPEVGADGSGLSCPGSKVVADGAHCSGKDSEPRGQPLKVAL
jgi:hypothetical protein